MADGRRGAVTMAGAAATMDQMLPDRLPGMPRRAFLLAALGVVAAACSQTSRASDGATAAAPRVSLPGEATPGVSLPSVSAPAPIATVGMIGDSITKLSTPSLEEVFAADGITPTIDAEVSRRIEVGNGKDEPLNGEQVLTNLNKIGLDPDAWVFALGTNDLTAYDEEGFGALIDSMLGDDRRRRPGRLGGHLPAEDAWRRRSCSTTCCASGPRSGRTPRWRRGSTSPRRIRKELISKDQVHPTDAGQAAFAQLVGDSIAALR